MKKDKNDFLLEQWKKAIELYLHGSEHIHKKINYFITINVALLSALGYIYLEETKFEKGIYEIFKFLIPSLGFLISLVWLFVHLREMNYQIFRVQQAKNAEKNIDNCKKYKLYLMTEDFDEWLFKRFINHIKNLEFLLKSKISINVEPKNMCRKLRITEYKSNKLIFYLYMFFITFWSIVIIFW